MKKTVPLYYNGEVVGEARVEDGDAVVGVTINAETMRLLNPNLNFVSIYCAPAYSLVRRTDEP